MIVIQYFALKLIDAKLVILLDGEPILSVGTSIKRNYCTHVVERAIEWADDSSHAILVWSEGK